MALLTSNISLYIDTLKTTAYATNICNKAFSSIPQVATFRKLRVTKLIMLHDLLHATDSHISKYSQSQR